MSKIWIFLSEKYQKKLENRILKFVPKIDEKKYGYERIF